MSEIKNCPCCGSEIKGGVRLTGYMMMNKQYIQCDACGLRMETKYNIDDMSQTHLKVITEDLINRWNTRKPMERIVERLDERYAKLIHKVVSDWQKSHLNDYEDFVAEGIEEAIEIVKEEGGV